MKRIIAAALLTMAVGLGLSACGVTVNAPEVTEVLPEVSELLPDVSEMLPDASPPSSPYVSPLVTADENAAETTTPGVGTPTASPEATAGTN